jgi:hypothetical protein
MPRMLGVFLLVVSMFLLKIATQTTAADACKEEVACTANEHGLLKGCACLSGACSGRDQVSGRALGCNRVTNRCAPCVPGGLNCQCRAEGACDSNLVCENDQCMPTPAFSLTCTASGDVGCSCSATRLCKQTLACSSQLSRCVACPTGCKQQCANAHFGISDNDTCAQTECTTCKTTPGCVWCGEFYGGCRTTSCPSGVAQPLCRCSAEHVRAQMTCFSMENQCYAENDVVKLCNCRRKLSSSFFFFFFLML